MTVTNGSPPVQDPETAMAAWQAAAEAGALPEWSTEQESPALETEPAEEVTA